MGSVSKAVTYIYGEVICIVTDPTPFNNEEKRSAMVKYSLVYRLLWNTRARIISLYRILKGKKGTANLEISVVDITEIPEDFNK